MRNKRLNAPEPNRVADGLFHFARIRPNHNCILAGSAETIRHQEIGPAFQIQLKPLSTTLPRSPQSPSRHFAANPFTLECHG
jgi:hypothetical protein